jgi:hypothetical protein
MVHFAFLQSVGLITHIDAQRAKLVLVAYFVLNLNPIITQE